MVQGLLALANTGKYEIKWNMLHLYRKQKYVNQHVGIWIHLSFDILEAIYGLSVQGCTTGPHCNEKPPEPEKPESKPLEDEVMWYMWERGGVC